MKKDRNPVVDILAKKYGSYDMVLNAYVCSEINLTAKEKTYLFNHTETKGHHGFYNPKAFKKVVPVKTKHYVSRKSWGVKHNREDV